MLGHRDLTKRVIGLAIEVHRYTGHALPESVYAACLAFELEQAGNPLLRKVGARVFDKAMRMQLGFPLAT